jgi:methionine-rich copper-binding protein CopC
VGPNVARVVGRVVQCGTSDDRSAIFLENPMKLKMHKLRVSIVAIVAAAFCSPAWSHARLLQSTPVANAVLTDAPKEVRIRFTEPLEGSFSGIEVTDASGKALTSDKAVIDSGDSTAMHLALPALKAGVYRVQWSAVTRDGHRVKGEYSFTVK